jgi:hypothetical protein
MDNKSATIFVTKLGAAERQLSVAIRMFLASEDELAVHTVASAAYQILRDLKGKKAHDDAHELFLLGLFSIAQELETGMRSSIPDNLSHPKVAEIVELFRSGIADGTMKEFKDITVVHDQRDFWKKFNEPANFLKHADTDPKGALDLSKIKNSELLMRAAGILVGITNRPTPEIEALMMYVESR